MTKTNYPRKRGYHRSSRAPIDFDQVREGIVEATRTVFSRVGYHGLSVELIITEADISRPTFYRYFRSIEEPMEILITHLNLDLMGRLMLATTKHESPLEVVDASICAWRDWGEDLGDFIKPYFAELYDMNSPVGRHRERSMQLLGTRIADLLEMMGRERPSDIRISAFLQGIEFMGYRYQLSAPKDELSWDLTRRAMFRLALGLLGSREEMENAAELANKLGYELI